MRWNFDVKQVDVAFGHNVEYGGSTVYLPISGVVLKRKSTCEGGMLKRLEVSLFRG